MGKLKKTNKMNNKIKNNKGQIAIIVLLVSAIVLTLGLSASKSTIVDTKINTDDESLKKAFNTAESAINNYLDSGKDTYTVEGGGASVVSTLIGGEGTQTISSDGQVLANSNQLFWLVNHDEFGGIGEIYYSGGNSVDLNIKSGFNGALKIDYFYINSVGDYKVKRWGCNYNGSNVVNGYSTDTSSCSKIVLSNEDDLLEVKPLLLSITPIGDSTDLVVYGSNFPVQGEDLTSFSITDSGVKTQIKIRNVYKIPLFLIDAISVRSIIQ